MLFRHWKNFMKVGLGQKLGCWIQNKSIGKILELGSKYIVEINWINLGTSKITSEWKLFESGLDSIY